MNVFEIIDRLLLSLALFVVMMGLAGMYLAYRRFKARSLTRLSAGDLPAASIPTFWSRRRWIVSSLVFVGVGAIAVTLLIVRDAQKYRMPDPASWQRYETSDGACSAEFPQRPGLIGASQSTRQSGLRIALDNGRVLLSLTWWEFPKDKEFGSDEERLDFVRDGMMPFWPQDRAKHRVVRDEVTYAGPVKGREVESEFGEFWDSQRICARFFIYKETAYRISTTTPLSMNDPAIRHYLNSIRFKDNAP